MFKRGKSQGEELPFWEVLEPWLSLFRPNTVRSYRAAWKLWCGFCDPRKAKRADVIRWVGEYKKEVGQKSRDNSGDLKCGSTIAHRINALKSIYNYLIKEGKVSMNPFENLLIKLPTRAEKRPAELCDFDKVGTILEKPDRKSKRGIRDRAILGCLFGGALRRSEIVNLRLCDIRVTLEGVLYLVLTDTKTGHKEEQALPAWAAERVSLLVNQRVGEGAKESEPLFVHYKADGSIGDRISDQKVARDFKRWAKEIGLPNLSAHSARVTAISKLLEQGIPFREVQEFSRHKSARMTELYDRRRRGPEKSAALKLKY